MKSTVAVARAPAAQPLSDGAFRRKFTAAEPPRPQLTVIASLGRRGAKARARPVIEEIGPTDEQMRRGCYHTVQVKDPGQAAPRFVKKNMDGRNLERWLNRELIDARQFRAGDKYRTDFELSGWQPRLVARYGFGGVGGEAAGPGPATERQMDAWRRWRAAREELSASLREGFDQLLLHDAGLDDVAVDPLGFYRPRTGMLAVKLCLTELVAFYGLPGGDLQSSVHSA